MDTTAISVTRTRGDDGYVSVELSDGNVLVFNGDHPNVGQIVEKFDGAEPMLEIKVAGYWYTEGVALSMAENSKSYLFKVICDSVWQMNAALFFYNIVFSLDTRLNDTTFDGYLNNAIMNLFFIASGLLAKKWISSIFDRKRKENESEIRNWATKRTVDIAQYEVQTS